MMVLLWLLPITLALGLAGVGVFMWSVRSGQFDDLDAAAYRILDDDRPPGRPRARPTGQPPDGEGGTHRASGVRWDAPPRTRVGVRPGST